MHKLLDAAASEADSPRQASDNRPALSVFFPACNEEANIAALLSSARSVLREVAGEYEIIVVDDGSRDRTAEIVRQAATRDGRVRLVRHSVNRGYGRALITGFAACRLPWVFFSDADNQFDLGELRLLLARREEADLVLGYRRHRQDPLVRKLNALGWCRLVRLVLGLRVRDVNCAFKLIRREVFDRVSLEASGAVISAELLTKAQRAGFRFVEVPVSHFPRTAGQPSGADPRVIARAFGELARLRRTLGKPGG